MKILFSIHLYPPKHNCGAELMIHNIGKFLQGKGHQVRVLLCYAGHYNITRVYEWEGIDVFPPSRETTEGLFRWCDIVFTHLDYAHWTIQMGRVYRKKVVHLIHNTHKSQSVEGADSMQYIAYNSEWARQEIGYKHPSTVLHPPCDWRTYDVKKDPAGSEYITLINLDGNKGGYILRQIAQRMPDKKFIGVKGSYSEPADQGQHVDQPANVVVMENTPDIMPVYERTRILIMPSKYESWGRTATEAMCSGIPVISSGTPGLRENCGKAGIYVERDDIDGWVKAIKKLDAPKEYKKWSDAALFRSRELDPMAELESFNEWIKMIYLGSL